MTKKPQSSRFTLPWPRGSRKPVISALVSHNAELASKLCDSEEALAKRQPPRDADADARQGPETAAESDLVSALVKHNAELALRLKDGLSAQMAAELQCRDSQLERSQALVGTRLHVHMCVVSACACRVLIISLSGACGRPLDAVARHTETGCAAAMDPESLAGRVRGAYRNIPFTASSTQRRF